MEVTTELFPDGTGEDFSIKIDSPPKKACKFLDPKGDHLVIDLRYMKDEKRTSINKCRKMEQLL